MECGRVMDGWSARDAWESFYKNEEFPPPVSSPETGWFSDVDQTVAAFFGELTKENLDKAHTAVKAIYPRLVLSPFPPSGHQGPSLKKHIATTTIKAMKEYRRDVGMLLSEIKHDIECLKSWELDCISDWFYIWDALGSTGASVQDSEMADFYKFAESQVRYGSL